MPKSKPLTDVEGEVRELTAADMKRFQIAKQTLPCTLLKKLNVRGSQKTPTKERIAIRLSPEVLQRFRDTGDGWQSPVDSALKDCLNRINLRAFETAMRYCET